MRRALRRRRCRRRARSRHPPNRRCGPRCRRWVRRGTRWLPGCAPSRGDTSGAIRRRWRAARVATGRTAASDFIEQFGRANQFFGEIRAVFEQVEHVSAQVGIGVQTVQSSGVPGKAFQKMLEGFEAAVQLGLSECGREMGSALFQRAHDVAGWRRPAVPPESGAGVDHAIVNLAHLFADEAGFDPAASQPSRRRRASAVPAIRARPVAEAGCGFGDRRQFASDVPVGGETDRRMPGARIRRRRGGLYPASARAPAWCRRGAPRDRRRRRAAASTAPEIRCRGCRRAPVSR